MTRSLAPGGNLGPSSFGNPKTQNKQRAAESAVEDGHSCGKSIKVARQTSSDDFHSVWKKPSQKTAPAYHLPKRRPGDLFLREGI